MKLLKCPINGLRPLQEFHYGGEVREEPDPKTCSDEQWADYVFHRSGEPAVKCEWWYHIASNTWFIAERDNKTDRIVRTYLFGEKGGASHV
jgi:sarcosine oxidase subunit delta